MSSNIRSQQTYEQTVGINFEGEDKLSQVVDKVSERIGAFQIKLTVANLGLQGFNKFTNANIKALETFTSKISVADKVLQKAFNITTLAKVGTVLADGLKQASKELQGFQSGLDAMAASGYSSQILDDFKRLGDAILFDKDALQQFSLQALSAYNQFAKAKAEVEVLFKPGDKFVANLSKNVQKLVNEDLKNAVTSIDALGASYQAASALFLEASENQAVMTAGLKLAKAGGADASATMQVLTQTIRAYNLQASDADKVAVAFNKTIQLGITTLPELAQGFAQTAVVAKEAGIKLEELSGAVAALTLKGSSTPSALTGIEALSRVIINKTPQATAALRDLRDEAGKPIKFDIAEIKAKGLAKALDDLNKAAKGNAQVLAEVIPESLAYSTALGLMADGAKQLKDNTKEISNVINTGAAARKALDEVFNIKINNQAEKFEAIINRITEQFIQFGEQLAPFFDAGVSAVENFSKLLSSISPETKKLIAQFLIAQLTFNQVNNAIGALVGSAVKAAGVFLGWRLTTSLFNGTLGKQINLITGLIKTNAGLLPVIKQIIGLDQSRLLINTNLDLNNKNKLTILQELIKGENGRIQSLKELVGWDKEYLLSVEKATNSLEELEKIKTRQIDLDSKVISTTKELDAVEKARDKLKEEGLSLYDKYNNLLEEEFDKKQILAKAEEELGKAYNNGDLKKANDLKAKVLQLQREQIENSEAQAEVQRQIADKAEEYAEAEVKVGKAQETVTNARTAARQRLSAITDLNIKKEALLLESAKYSQISNKAAASAEALRLRAKLDSANASVLLARAERAEAISRQYNLKAIEAANAAEAVNIALKQAAKQAAIQQAIAEGTLIEVNTLLGKTYIANNIITRFFYKELNFSVKGAIDNVGKLLSKTKEAGGGIFSLLAGARGGLIVGFTKLTALIKGGTVAIGGMTLGLSALLAPLLVLLPIAGVLYDQFAGTGKQIRDMNNNLKDVEKNRNSSIIKILREAESVRGLTIEEAKRLNVMEQQRRKLNEQQSFYDGFWSSVGRGFKKIGEIIAKPFQMWDDFVQRQSDYFEDLLMRIPVVGSLLSGILDTWTKGLGRLWDDFNLDRVQTVLGKINEQVKETQEANIEAIKKNQNAIKGLTGDRKIDELLKGGGELDTKAQTRIKQLYETDKKIAEERVKANQKVLDDLNEKLKDFDSKSEEEQKRASSKDKALAQERDKLEAENEKYKKAIDKADELNKTAEKYFQDRNQLIKRIRDNKLDITGTTTQATDVGVNAIETRLKKSLRQSEEDLADYSKKILNMVNSNNQNILDLGENALQKFDEKVAVNIAAIQDLYDSGYLSAEEASKKTIATINAQVDAANGASEKLETLLSNDVFINNVNLALKYSKEASSKRVEQLTDEANLQKALNEAGVTSALETSKKIRQIQSTQLEEQIQATETTISLLLKTYGSNSDVTKEAQRKLSILQAQQKANNLNNVKAELQERFKLQQDAYAKEEAELKLSKAKFGVTEDEYLTELESLNKKQNLNKQEQLKKQLELVKNDKEKQQEIQRQLLNLQLEYQQIVTEALDYEFTKRNKIIQNNTTAEIQDYQRLISTLNNTSSSLEQEVKIIESRNKLNEATQQYEEGRLRNQLRTTADIQKRADIELEIVNKQQEYLPVQQKAERESFIYQQKTVDLALQRQQIELNIKILENETSNKLLQLEIERAKQRKVSGEELRILTLKLEANEEENKNLASSQKLLDTNRKNQQEIAANAFKELEYKQELARNGGVLDLEIAKRNQIIAGYERAAKQAQIAAEIVNLNADKQLKAQEYINKAYEQRTSILQKQLEIEENKQSNIQRQFSLAADLTTNERQKQKLQEYAAKQELLALNTKQKIEQQVLEIQLQSNRAALQRAKIEQEVAKIKLAAEVKVQEAETKKVLASKTATEEEKQAAIAQLDAKTFARDAQGYEDVLLQQREQQLTQEESLARFNLAQKQRNEVQDREISLARLTRSKGDDRAILRALKNNLRPDIENLKEMQLDRDRFGSLFSSSAGFNYQTPEMVMGFEEYLKSKKQNISINQPQVNAASNNSIASNSQTTSTNKQPVVINFDNTNNIKIEGDNATSEYAKEIQKVTYESMYGVIRKLNTELNNR